MHRISEKGAFEGQGTELVASLVSGLVGCPSAYTRIAAEQSPMLSLGGILGWQLMSLLGGLQIELWIEF